MKYVIPLIVFFILNTQVYSDLIYSEYYEDKINVEAAEPHQEEKIKKLNFGEEVIFEIKIYESKFFDRNIISANAHIENNSDNDVLAVYSIAFFDGEEQMVGCVQGNWNLAGNSDVDYGSGIVYADEESVRLIESVKVLISVFD